MTGFRRRGKNEFAARSHHRIDTTHARKKSRGRFLLSLSNEPWHVPPARWTADFPFDVGKADLIAVVRVENDRGERRDRMHSRNYSSERKKERRRINERERERERRKRRGQISCPDNNHPIASASRTAAAGCSTPNVEPRTDCSHRSPRR